MSVNKLSEEGYTTIFHPENEGVTVHERGIISQRYPLNDTAYVRIELI
jgi:hypothetical protein